MEKFAPILEQYGISGIILLLAVYMLWKGEIYFKYPRCKKKK